MILLNIFETTLPLTNPILKFLLILVIILFAPILLNKIKIPHLLGLIIAGAIIGPYGINLMERDSSIILSGTAGLLYIMFLTEDGIATIHATADRIAAGANYVAGRINVEGKLIDTNAFQLKGSNKIVKPEQLQRFLESKAFYRVKIGISAENMIIEFYTEK
ncbi:MAG TPA: cation:proton antiporter [Brumimicrobium sp.]|nr:cation:proton antiporter [Brumimicrobium sp.]